MSFFDALPLYVLGETFPGHPERNAEGGRRKAEGGRWKVEGGRRKAEGGRRKAEDGRRHMKHAEGVRDHSLWACP